MAERRSHGNSKSPVSTEKESTSTVELVTSDESDPDVVATKDGKCTGGSATIECPVCMQDAVYPVQLPCGHIFCFLCIKGVAVRSACCALCRRPIPGNFFSKPNVLPTSKVTSCDALADGEYLESDGSELVREAASTSAGALTKKPEKKRKKKHNWYYEGINGWWQYDERSTLEIETAYKEKKPNTEILIAGNLYVIDMENMMQFRRNDPGRRRRIKRDLRDAPIKGIAGLKLEEVVKLINDDSAEPGTSTDLKLRKDDGAVGNPRGLDPGDDQIGNASTPVMTPSNADIIADDGSRSSSVVVRCKERGVQPRAAAAVPVTEVPSVAKQSMSSIKSVSTGNDVTVDLKISPQSRDVLDRIADCGVDDASGPENGVNFGNQSTTSRLACDNTAGAINVSSFGDLEDSHEESSRASTSQTRNLKSSAGQSEMTGAGDADSHTMNVVNAISNLGVMDGSSKQRDSS